MVPLQAVSRQIDDVQHCFGICKLRRRILAHASQIWSCDSDYKRMATSASSASASRRCKSSAIYRQRSADYADSERYKQPRSEQPRSEQPRSEQSHLEPPHSEPPHFEQLQHSEEQHSEEQHSEKQHSEEQHSEEQHSEEQHLEAEKQHALRFHYSSFLAPPPFRQHHT